MCDLILYVTIINKICGAGGYDAVNFIVKCAKREDCVKKRKQFYKNYKGYQRIMQVKKQGRKATGSQVIVSIVAHTLLWGIGTVKNEQ